MEKQYYVMRSSNTTLSHGFRGKEKADHKYVKKEWSNGKWKYYYEEDTDDLLSSQTKISTKDGSGAQAEHIITKKGKLSRLFEKGKASLEKLFNSDTKTDAKTVEKKMDDGRSFVKDVLGIGLRKEVKEAKAQVESYSHLKNQAMINKSASERGYAKEKKDVDDAKRTIERLDRIGYKKEDVEAEKKELAKVEVALAVKNRPLAKMFKSEEEKKNLKKIEADLKNKQSMNKLKSEWAERDEKASKEAAEEIRTSTIQMTNYSNMGKEYAKQVAEYSSLLSMEQRKYKAAKSTYDETVLGRAENWFKNLFK